MTKEVNTDDCPPTAPPNILLVMADQMTPFMPQACAGVGARTANLQALADRGVHFSTAHTSSPICAPARSSLMTGLNVSRMGCYDNGDLFPSFVPTFAHYLTNQGYEVVLSGKMHFIGADQLHGFKHRLTTDLYPSDFKWHIFFLMRMFLIAFQKSIGVSFNLEIPKPAIFTLP
jgi:choline-sulfatase